jgi:hypothetical protein
VFVLQPRWKCQTADGAEPRTRLRATREVLRKAAIAGKGQVSALRPGDPDSRHRVSRSRLAIREKMRVDELIDRTLIVGRNPHEL